MEQAVSSIRDTFVPERAAGFDTTHWSAVFAAGETGSNGAGALEQLCRAYWYPLYAYVRRRGHGPEEAQDLTQSFFERLIAKHYLPNASPERGKFRTFLLTSLQRFLVNEWNKQCAVKRGGRTLQVSWDEEQTESRYLAENAVANTPEKLFEKRWATALLEQVLARLREEFVDSGRGEQFERLKVLLWGEKTAPPYAEVAAQMSMTEGALKVAVHRFRQRYRELLRAEVARTVASPAEVDAELRHLIEVISE